MKGLCRLDETSRYLTQSAEQLFIFLENVISIT